jgi:tRNA-(ms[2]io[6]A)-hydroxylase
MLGLKLVTDPRWVNIVESNIEEILTDHAWCNKSCIKCNKSHYLQLELESNRVISCAREELEHLQMVHDLIKSKGLTLGRERKDHYVNEL